MKKATLKSVMDEIVDHNKQQLLNPSGKCTLAQAIAKAKDPNNPAKLLTRRYNALLQ